MKANRFLAKLYRAEQLSDLVKEVLAEKWERSFANLAEGKAVCVMEAATKEAVAAWFNKMGMPFDSITKVELEGDRGNIRPA